MKHEMTQWKCFVPDTPSFCDHIWSRVEFFSKIEHKKALVSIIIAMDTRSPEKLVMITKGMNRPSGSSSGSVAASGAAWYDSIDLYCTEHTERQQQRHPKQRC